LGEAFEARAEAEALGFRFFFCDIDTVFGAEKIRFIALSKFSLASAPSLNCGFT
jgi:hypothetical protein